jgi:hypothetical protein
MICSHHFRSNYSGIRQLLRCTSWIGFNGRERIGRIVNDREKWRMADIRTDTHMYICTHIHACIHVYIHILNSKNMEKQTFIFFCLFCSFCRIHVAEISTRTQRHPPPCQITMACPALKTNYCSYGTSTVMYCGLMQAGRPRTTDHHLNMRQYIYSWKYIIYL